MTSCNHSAKPARRWPTKRCAHACAFCVPSRPIAPISRGSRGRSGASSSCSRVSSPNPSGRISCGWRRRSGAPTAKPPKHTTGAWSSRPVFAFSAVRAVYAPLWLDAARGALGARQPGAQAEPRVLCLQAPLRESTPLLRLDVRGLRRLQLRQARADGRLERTICAGHRRPRKNRISSIPQAPAGGCARGRHHPLSRRCGATLRQGSRLRGVSRSPADSRPRPASRAERGAVRAVSARAPAAARLHPQQRVPDRAPARRVLPAPARAGNETAGRRSRSTGGRR